MLSINTSTPIFNVKNKRIELISQQGRADLTADLVQVGRNLSEPFSNSKISLNPLHSYTRINGHTIPRSNLPLYMPDFTPADCTAHMSHEQWWASLDHEIKLVLDSVMNVPGTGEHISHLDSEERFHMINSTKMHIEKRKYFDAVSNAFEELATSMGLVFTGARSSSMPNDPNAFIHKAFFECPNGGEGKVVVLLPCGRKVFSNTPEDFTRVDFDDFFNDVMNRLMERLGENNEMSSSSIKRFFEENFENRFGDGLNGRI